MRSLLLRWLILALAVLLAAHVVPGFHVRSLTTAFLAAMVLGLLNAFVRPVLVLLTLPINILTLGLFILVINACLIWLVAGLLSGFRIDSFSAAMLGALVISISMLVREGRSKE